MSMWHRTRWLKAVWESNLAPLERLVAAVFADHAGSDRTAYVALDRLCQRSGLGRTSAQQHRRGLIQAGWLVEVRGATQHSAAHYELAIPDAGDEAGTSIGHAVPSSKDSADTQDAGRRQLEGATSRQAEGAGRRHLTNSEPLAGTNSRTTSAASHRPDSARVSASRSGAMQRGATKNSTPPPPGHDWDDLLDDWDLFEQWLDEHLPSLDDMAYRTVTGMWERGAHPLAILNALRRATA